MVKRTKSNKRSKGNKQSKRHQRGGVSLNPLNWFSDKNGVVGGAENPYPGPEQAVSKKQGLLASITDSFKGTVEQTVESAKGFGEGLKGEIAGVGEKAAGWSSSFKDKLSGVIGKKENQPVEGIQPVEGMSPVEGMPPNGEVMPPNGEGMPPNGEVMPPNGEVMPPVEGMQQQNMSPGQQVMAQKGGKCKTMGGIIKCAMKGGKGGSDLTYYAAPVHGLKVAEPKYWINGGSKRRSRKSRKGRKGRKSRKSRKSRKGRKM